MYGTLRDDDDSGAAWTADFIRHISFACSGVVRGASMWWGADLNYPFVMLHPAAGAVPLTFGFCIGLTMS